MRGRILLPFLLLILQFSSAQDWNRIIKTAANDRGTPGDNYGYAVALANEYAIIGAPYEDEDAAGANTKNDAGAVYVLQKSGTSWVQVQKIVANDRADDDNFGASVAFFYNTIVVGAPFEDEDTTGSNTLSDAGSIYVFTQVGGTWVQSKKLVPDDRAAGDNFGNSVGMYNNFILAGAYLNDGDTLGANYIEDAGAAYVFKYDNGWFEFQKLVANDRSYGDNFGNNVFIDDDALLVCANQEGSETISTAPITKNLEGAVYYYEQGMTTGFDYKKKLTAFDRAVGDNFGICAVYSSGTVAVGANQSGASDEGAVYLFKALNNTVNKLTAFDAAANDNYGSSLALWGSSLAVGAPQEDEDSLGGNTLASAGSVYLYSYNYVTNIATELTKIVAPDRAAGDMFGFGVSITENRLVVSAMREDEDANGANSVANAGSAYFYINAYKWTGAVDTDWSTAGNWQNNTVPDYSTDVIIPATSNDPVINTDPASQAQCYHLDISNGASVTVNPGKAIYVIGDIDNGGSFYLKADATGIGMIKCAEEIMGLGDYHVENYLTGSGGATPNGRTYYLSSPVSAATSNVCDAAGNNQMWSYSESAFSFTEITNNVTAIQPNFGYPARLGSNSTIDFTGGELNSGYQNIHMNRTGTSNVKRGYNLLGNPFPAFINWHYINSQAANLSPTIWFRNVNNSNTMVFDTYNAVSEVGTNNNQNGDATRAIAPMQGFWVYIPNDGDQSDIFVNSGDVFFSYAEMIGPTPVVDQALVRMNISDGTNIDQAIVLFNENALDALDNYDSEKMFTSQIPQIYTSEAQYKLTINGLNSITSNSVVPITLDFPNNGQYQLSAAELKGFGSDKQVYLQDVQTSTIINLSDVKQYNFTANKGTSSARFNLLFEEGTTSVSAGGGASSSSVFLIDNNIMVKGTSKIQFVKVLDVTGKELYQTTTNDVNVLIDSKNFEAGIYFVNVQCGDQIQTHKIFISK